MIQPDSASNQNHDDDELRFSEETGSQKHQHELPNLTSVVLFNTHAKKALIVLEQVQSTNKKLNPQSQSLLTNWLDDGLTLMRQQNLASAALGKLGGSAMVAEGLLSAHDGFLNELTRRDIPREASVLSELWSAIKTKSWIGKTLPNITEGQMEIIRDSPAEIIVTLAGSYAKPPITRQREIDSENMTAEDPLVILARNLAITAVRYCSHFQFGDIPLEHSAIREQRDKFAIPHATYTDFKANLFELVEQIAETEAIDLTKLSVEGRKHYQSYFPTIVIDQLDPNENHIGAAWKVDSLKRVLTEDYKLYCAVAFRKDTITNALASSGREVDLFQAMKSVDPGVRKLLINRLQAIFIRRSEQLTRPTETSSEPGIERYYIDIPDSLVLLSKEQKNDVAREHAYQLARDLVNRLVPAPRSPSF